ncbi:MAG: hypothetical protein GY849_16430 [Deltaproteobacteria bacterium]|nr:hypothetical protein [Deltaproteobacteria bacterium]
MSTRQVRNLLSKRLLIACALSLVVTGALVFQHFKFRHRIDQDIKTHAHETAVKAAQEIDREISRLMPVATALADDLTNGVFKNEKELIARIHKGVVDNPMIWGYGAAFKPGAGEGLNSDPNRKLYSPRYRRNIKKGGFSFGHTSDAYDYSLPVSDDPNAPDTKWFHDPLKQGAMWNEPYFGTSSQRFIAEYSVPFYKDAVTKKEPQGLVSISYGLKWVQNLLDSLEIGKTGYGFIISQKGKFVAHPLFDAYVKGGKTIYEELGQRLDERLKTEISKALNGEQGMFSYKDPWTGQSAWIAYEPIASTGWSLGIVYIKEISPLELNQLGRQQMWILILGLIFIFLGISAGLAGRFAGVGSQNQERLLWGGVTGISVLSLAALSGIWFLVLSDQLGSAPERAADTEEVTIVDHVGLDRYLEQKTRIFKDSDEPAVMVPTGIFIQSLEFASANNVFLTGYIWQKYKDGVHEGLSRGFVLPEATSESTSEAYRRKEGDTELIGWYFEASLRQGFDYSKYPFDDVLVWIRLWHKDFDKNVILTPDLKAYRSLFPRSLPGVEEEFVLNGWDLEKSFFNYKSHRYNTNFGIENYVGQEDFPELYFNIGMKRNFLDAFVGHLSPLMVVAFMIFGTLLTFTRKKESSPLSGYNALAALGACAGLFFLVLLGHIQLRGAFGVPQVMYLEYFYFVMYFMILWVSVYALIFSNTHIKNGFLHGHDGLVAKLLFWPLMLVSMVVITFGVFY